VLPQEILAKSPKNLEEYWENLLPDQCTGCEYKDLRVQIVKNRGDGSCGLCFCGEGPGATEDDCGLPFSGKAGKLMDDFLQAANINPARCWFTNAVKCRPFPRDQDKPSPPSHECMIACRPLLVKEMELLNPPLLVALGKQAYKTLSGDTGDPQVKPLVGNFFYSESLKRKFVVLYHPSYLGKTVGYKMTSNDEHKQMVALLKRLSLMANLTMHERRKMNDGGCEGS
jgi:uracil-DNA glycosylase family 4